MKLGEHVVVADRFRLVRELGRGGMGAVWLAHHTELDVPCAVKFILTEAMDLADVRDRFAREARAAAQLRSPNVVQILDYGVWEDIPYIAMEYLEGEDLSARLARVKKLPKEECVFLIGQVARALSRAHSSGIIHRDLKPENIYIVRDDDRELVKVLDFGIAKMSPMAGSPSFTSRGETKTGALLGTPCYMSPEQAQGFKEVDYQCDLWALAVITFECLTGQRPFDSDAIGALILQIVVHPLPIPSILDPELPATFDVWWTKAVSRSMEERFQSAREFMEEFGNALGVSVDMAVATSVPPPPGPSDALGTGVRPRRSAPPPAIARPGSSGALNAGNPSGAVVSMTTGEPVERTRIDTSILEDSPKAGPWVLSGFIVAALLGTLGYVMTFRTDPPPSTAPAASQVLSASPLSPEASVPAVAPAVSTDSSAAPLTTTAASGSSKPNLRPRAPSPARNPPTSPNHVSDPATWFPLPPAPTLPPFVEDASAPTNLYEILPLD